MGIHRHTGKVFIPVVERPICFRSDLQWKLWREARLACPPNQAPMFGVCTDCTPEYKKQMLLENRCEHPETRFTKDNDGFLCGYWPEQEAA